MHEGKRPRATVAAIVALAAAMTTNLTTSLLAGTAGRADKRADERRAGKRFQGIARAMSVAATSEDWTVMLTSEAPSQIPGQMRSPSSSTEAKAIPEAGHTAVA